MATKFKQITTVLQAHQAGLEKLPSAAPEHDKACLDEIADDVDGNIRGQIKRYVERANETEEEKQLYGPKMIGKIRELETLFHTVDSLMSLKRAVVDSNFAQRCAETAAAAAVAEEARVSKLQEHDKLREAERLELAHQKQRSAQEEAQAAAKAAAIAEEQSRALAAARAEKEAARAAEEAEYKAKQRRLAAQREADEAQRMVDVQQQQAAAARSVLEARSQGSSRVLQSAGLQPGVVNEAHNLQQLESFIQTTQSTGMPCVVDYFAPWCGPCVQFAPTFQAMAAQYRDVIFVKVNCDNAAGVSSSKGIRAFPTFHSYVRGALRQSWSGASLTKLQAALSDASQAEEAAALQDAVALSTGGGAVASGGVVFAPSSTRHDGPPEYSIVPGIMSERPMGQLLQRLATAVTREDFEAACKLLRAYVKNVTEPSKRDDQKYRTVQSSNSAFQQRLAKHGAIASELMQCAGFSDSDGAWVLPMGSSTAEAAALSARPVLEAAARQAAEAALPQVSAPARPSPPPSVPQGGGGGGLGGLANALGGGGMAGLMRNPEIMRAAQQMMGGGGMDPSMMARLAQNPQMAAMAQQFMQNPQAMQQAQRMAGSPQAAAQLQQMLGAAAAPAAVPPATPAPAPAPAPARSPAPSPASAAAPAGTATPAAGAGGSDQPDIDPDSDYAVVAALSASMFGEDPDGV